MQRRGWSGPNPGMISPLAGAIEEEPSASPAVGLCTAAGEREAVSTEGRAVGTLGLAPAATVKGAAAAELAPATEGATAAELGPGVEVLAGGVGPWRTRGLKE